MKQEIVLKQHFALSQKTSGDSTQFGLGFNYTVEAKFKLTSGLETDQCLEALKKAVAKVDHKALGVDADLGFEPTTANLCRFFILEIQKNYPPGARVRLVRGDGLVAEFF